MKSYYFIFLFAVNFLNAQNLVPNPSFEVYTGLLQTFMHNGNLSYAQPWFNTPAFSGGGGATPDYINITMPLTLYNNDTYEFQTPKSGNAIACFYSCNYSPNIEYVLSEPFQIRLKEPMEMGEIYQVSFYVKKANYYNPGACFYGSDELGTYFHTDTIYGMAYESEHEDISKIENSLNLYVMDTTIWGNPYPVFRNFYKCQTWL